MRVGPHADMPPRSVTRTVLIDAPYGKVFSFLLEPYNLPDWAIVDVTTPPNSRFPGKIANAGFFGERWELLTDQGK